MVLGVKVAQRLHIACHQSGGGKLGKLHQGQFFRMVTQGLRAVEYACAFAFGLLQHMRGVQVFGIKRRVFAHQHRIKVFQGGSGRVFNAKPRILRRQTCLSRYQFNSIGLRRYAAFSLPMQIVQLASGHAPAPCLRLLHHGVGGVFVDFEVTQRVGDKQQFHGRNYGGK